MQSLNTIVARASLPVPEYHLDRFQGRVLEELHLEFFFARCQVLITPTLKYFATGEASDEERSQIESILAQRQSFIDDLKRYLIFSLSLYSALLETNSYIISVNDHLMIARFVSLSGQREGFEVKLYTLRREDLPTRYADKIYLGRDFLFLDRLDRDHFGLRQIRTALREQNVRLRGRLETHVPGSLRDSLERDFLLDLRELIEEFSRKADDLLRDFPPSFPGDHVEEPTLLDMNGRFRELKHLLIESDDVLREMEERLFEKAPRAARYVTKYRKDVANDVNYIMLKINGRISDAVNGIRL
ncbi:MAG: hypothetical protein JXO72_10670 [Vicinamibacteria bacterium]|nr:hypothetical protein [Vicinamibacteria bacterium]